MEKGYANDTPLPPGMMPWHHVEWEPSPETHDHILENSSEEVKQLLSQYIQDQTAAKAAERDNINQVGRKSTR